jgi:hypothetical protein
VLHWLSFRRERTASVAAGPLNRDRNAGSCRTRVVGLRHFAGAWTARQHLYMYMPTKDRAGLTLRAFDPEKRQWSIDWVSSVTGKLDPVPVAGGFAGKHGEFYAADEDNGRPIKVFERADPARACENGRPRREKP